MNDIIKVDGTNECFGDLIIVETLEYKGLIKEYFPNSNDIRHILRKMSSKTKEDREKKKIFNTLCFSIDNVHNIGLPFTIYEYRIFLQKIPSKFYIKKTIIHPTYSGYYFVVSYFRPQIVSYLDNIKKFFIFKEFFKELGKYKDGTDFYEYIDDWAKKLLRI